MRTRERVVNGIRERRTGRRRESPRSAPCQTARRSGKLDCSGRTAFPNKIIPAGRGRGAINFFTPVTGSTSILILWLSPGTCLGTTRRPSTCLSPPRMVSSLRAASQRGFRPCRFPTSATASFLFLAASAPGRCPRSRGAATSSPGTSPCRRNWGGDSSDRRGTSPPGRSASTRSWI